MIYQIYIILDWKLKIGNDDLRNLIIPRDVLKESSISRITSCRGYA